MSDEVAIPDPNRVTKYIWRNIGKKSAREMAEELGVGPEEILRAKRELLDEIDPLTIQVQKAKLLNKLQEMADDAHERSQNVADERNYSGMVNAAAGAIDKLLKELNRSAAQDAAAVEALNKLRVRELLHLIDVTVDRTLRDIAKTHDLDYDELQDVFSTHLRPVAEAMDNS